MCRILFLALRSIFWSQPQCRAMRSPCLRNDPHTGQISADPELLQLLQRTAVVCAVAVRPPSEVLTAPLPPGTRHSARAEIRCEWPLSNRAEHQLARSSRSAVERTTRVRSWYSERPVSAHLTHWLARRSASEAAHFGHSSGGREGRLREVLSSNR